MPLRDWKKGDPIKADHLQEPVDELKKLGTLETGDDTRIDKVGDIAYVNLQSRPWDKAGFWGKVVAAPSGESEYSDARYWVKVQTFEAQTDNYAVPSVLDGTSVFGTRDPDEPDADPPVWVHTITAYNVAEHATGTHLLPVDTVVRVWLEQEEATYSSSLVPVMRFLMNVPPGDTVIRFKLTGNATGDEVYNGKSLTTPSVSSFTGGSAAVESTLGTLADADDVLAINLTFWGEVGHALSTSAEPLYFDANLLGYNSSGKKVVTFQGIQRYDCSAT